MEALFYKCLLDKLISREDTKWWRCPTSKSRVFLMCEICSSYSTCSSRCSRSIICLNDVWAQGQGAPCWSCSASQCELCKYDQHEPTAHEGWGGDTGHSGLHLQVEHLLAFGSFVSVSVPRSAPHLISWNTLTFGWCHAIGNIFPRGVLSYGGPKMT